MRAIVFLMISVLIFIACEEKVEFLPQKPQVIQMKSTTQEVQLPSRLWEELESVYRPMIFDNTATLESEGSRARLEIPKDFFSFHVFLKEKTPGVLNNRAGYDLNFGSSGGILDFQEFLASRKGTFYFGFRPELEIKKDDVFRVYYLSNSKFANIGGELHGAGCSKYLDITEYFRSKMTKEGILLNTTGGRHAALMAGTYFFATSLKGKLYLSQLTVKDSRFKKLHCAWKQ